MEAFFSGRFKYHNVVENLRDITQVFLCLHPTTFERHITSSNFAYNKE